MIQHYIFDIGNVIVDFHPIPFFEAIMPNKQMEQVCPLIFADEWEQIDAGEYTCAQVRSMMLDSYPMYEEQIHCIFDQWMEMMKLNEDTIHYMKELQEQGNKVYLLSNIGEESHTYLSTKYGFFDWVDGMVLSYKIHCNKPDPRIYQTLLETYDLPAADCVFFDDREGNIHMAQQLGMHGIVFRDIKQAKEEVVHLCCQSIK